MLALVPRKDEQGSSSQLQLDVTRLFFPTRFELLAIHVLRCKYVTP